MLGLKAETGFKKNSQLLKTQNLSRKVMLPIGNIILVAIKKKYTTYVLFTPNANKLKSSLLEMNLIKIVSYQYFYTKKSQIRKN